MQENDCNHLQDVKQTAPLMEGIRKSTIARVMQRTCAGHQPLEAICQKHGLDPNVTTIEEVFANHLILLALVKGNTEAMRQIADRMWGKVTENMNVNMEVDGKVFALAMSIAHHQQKKREGQNDA